MSKCVDPLGEASLNRPSESVERACRRRNELDAVHPARSVDAIASAGFPARILEVQVAFQSGPINASSFCAGSRGGFIVEPVLDLP